MMRVENDVVGKRTRGVKWERRGMTVDDRKYVNVIWIGDEGE